MELISRQATFKRCRHCRSNGTTVLRMLAFVSFSAIRVTRSFPSNAALLRRTRHSYMVVGRYTTVATARIAMISDEWLDGGKSSSSGLSSTSSIPFHSLDSVKRVFCISDLHADHPDNLLWLSDQCRRGGGGLLQEDDLVVVAGDISHDLPTFRAALQILLQATSHVLFVPGNHEAWLSSLPRRRNASGGSSSSSSATATSFMDGEPQDSLEKLDQVYSVCRDMGVWTEALLVGASTNHPLWLVPLQSWYDGSLSLEGCEDLCRDFGRWPWVDFQRCLWPAPYLPEPPTSDNPRIPMGLNDLFLQRNQASLEFVAQQIRNDNNNQRHGQRPASVMTISHFLPNQQCLPDWKDVQSPRFLRSEWLDHGAPGISAKFAKVAGSSSLDQQLRLTLHDDNDNVDGSSLLLDRHIHVFGHSHRPKDFKYKGIRYIHNPLGKPRERQMHMVNPLVNYQLVWDTTKSGEVPTKIPVIRYWEEHGGGKDALRQRMVQPFTRMASTTATATTSSTSNTALLQEQVLRVSYSNSSSQRLALSNSTTTMAKTTYEQSLSSAAAPTKASARLALLVSENNTRTDIAGAVDEI